MGSLESEAGPFTVLFGKNNTGKTNILEILYGIFEPSSKRMVRARNRSPGAPQLGEIGPSRGDVYVELEQGVFFDDYVSAYFNWPTTTPPSQPPSRRIAFTEDGLLQGDPWDNLDEHGRPNQWPDEQEHIVAVRAWSPVRACTCCFSTGMSKSYTSGSRTRSAFSLSRSQAHVSGDPPSWREPWPWLEPIDLPPRPFLSENLRTDSNWGVVPLWRVNPAIHSRLDQLGSLATDLLPDFVDDPIRARVIEPAYWEFSTKVGLYYGDYRQQRD